MKSKTHIYMADLLIEDLRANRIVLPGVGTFIPPAEIREAVLNHPGAFRAGSVGPDFYPDVLLGQATIHPNNSGKWLDLMFKRLLVSPIAEREKNLSFTLGFMMHYAGDMFGHAYVNSYAGGWFPDFMSLPANPEKAKIIARHMLVEAYMDQKVPASASMQLAPPIDFICDVFTCDEAQQLMSSLGVNNSLANPLGHFIQLRRNVHGALLDTAIGILPLVTDYVQHWEVDVDTGIKTWLETWAKTADAFAGNVNEKFTYVQGILENWFILKFTSMIGFPDFVGKVISFINNLHILKPLKDFIKNLFKDFLLAILKAITGQLYTTIEQAIIEIEKIFKDPKTYLDNGLLFSEKNISQKLDQDFGNYGQESNTTGQTFHAVYKCLNMSKLCLVGSDNLNTIVKNAVGNVSTNISFRGVVFSAAARIGYITVKTSTSMWAGTDNNIYIGIRYGGKSYEVLCDKPGYNDFERGDLDTYPFVVPENVDLSSVSAITARMSGNTPAGDWKCDWIQIKDSSHTVLLQADDDFWLEKKRPLNVITKFSRKYSIPSKSLCLDPSIISFLWSLDGQGKDNLNPTGDTPWGLGFRFYTDPILRNKVFQPLFETPAQKPVADEIVGVRASIGEIVDSVTFVYASGVAVKLGGVGGNATEVSMFKPHDRIISAVYTMTEFISKSCIGKIVFKTSSGAMFTYTGRMYKPVPNEKVVIISAPMGQYIVSFKDACPGPYLNTLVIAETRCLQQT